MSGNACSPTGRVSNFRGYPSAPRASNRCGDPTKRRIGGWLLPSKNFPPEASAEIESSLCTRRSTPAQISSLVRFGFGGKRTNTVMIVPVSIFLVFTLSTLGGTSPVQCPADTKSSNLSASLSSDANHGTARTVSALEGTVVVESELLPQPGKATQHKKYTSPGHRTLRGKRFFHLPSSFSVKSLMPGALTIPGAFSKDLGPRR